MDGSIKLKIFKMNFSLKATAYVWVLRDEIFDFIGGAAEIGHQRALGHLKLVPDPRSKSVATRFTLLITL